MEKKLLQFILRLRQGGIPVTLGETLDAMEALKIVPADREAFYHTLRSTLVKDAAHFHLFDKIFRYFFGPGTERNSAGGGEKGRKENLFAEIYPEAGGTQRGAGIPGQGRSGMRARYFVHLVQRMDRGAWEDYIRTGLAEVGPLEEKDLHDREDLLRRVMVRLEWKMGENYLEKAMAEMEEARRLEVAERLKEIRQLLEDMVDEALLAKFGEEALTRILQRENLRETDFYCLRENQVEEIRRKIVRLARRLATRPSRRKGRASRGTVDLARTLRKIYSTGGVPLRLYYRAPLPDRPVLAVLCDVSGSVRLFSEFMLQFLYTVQNRFREVRSFVFVDAVEEVTELFRGREVEEAIARMYREVKCNRSGFSNYGLVWEEFVRRYLPSLSKETVLLVLGDARNNYYRDGREYLQEIRQRVKKIIWLNPEPKERWHTEDSIIGRYEPLVDQLFECRNLKQLEQVAAKIVRA